MLAIVLAGLVGFRFLPLSALPQVDYPTIQVQTLYPGASPEVMSRTVTAPLERQFGQMAGLDRMSSTSAAGVSIVTLQFALDQTLDVAEQQVQAAINAGGSLLPADLPAPPVYAKVNPADAPMLTLAVSSDTHAADRGAEPRQHAPGAEDQPGQRRRPGVARRAGSGRRCASRPTRSALASVRHRPGHAAHRHQRRPTPTAPRAASTARSAPTPSTPTTSCVTAADYKNLIVAYKNGAPVRMTDVARVVDGAENTQLGAWAGSSAKRRADCNAGHHPQRAAPAGRQRDRAPSTPSRSSCPSCRPRCPASLKVEVLSDRTTGIRASVQPRADRTACWPWCWWCW